MNKLYTNQAKLGLIFNSQLVVYFSKRFMKHGNYSYTEKALINSAKKLKQVGLLIDFPTILSCLVDSLYLNIEHRPRRVGKQIKQIPSPVRRSRLLKKNISFIVNIIKSNTNYNLSHAIFEEILDSFVLPRAKLWIEYTTQVNLVYSNRLNLHWRW